LVSIKLSTRFRAAYDTVVSKIRNCNITKYESYRKL